MSTPQRGIVLQFHDGRNAAMRLRSPLRVSAGAATAPAIALPPETGDDHINADWDRLMQLASQAWSWRDPESLDTLEQAVARLRTWIDRDWSR